MFDIGKQDKEFEYEMEPDWLFKNLSVPKDPENIDFTIHSFHSEYLRNRFENLLEDGGEEVPEFHHVLSLEHNQDECTSKENLKYGVEESKEKRSSELGNFDYHKSKLNQDCPLIGKFDFGRNSLKRGVDLDLVSNLGDAGDESECSQILPFLDQANPKRLRKNNYTRWGKEEDKSLFMVLKTKLELQRINFDEFLELSVEQISSFEHIINDVAEESKWKGSIKGLIKRIHSLSCTQRLSVRETALLKQNLREQRKKIVRKLQSSIDYEEIRCHFPGKILDTIIEEGRKY